MAELTNPEIRSKLLSYGYNSPPVTASTRSVLLQKLTSFEHSSDLGNTNNNHSDTSGSDTENIQMRVEFSNGNDSERLKYKEQSSTSKPKIRARNSILNDDTRRKLDLSMDMDFVGRNTLLNPASPKSRFSAVIGYPQILGLTILAALVGVLYYIFLDYWK